MINQLRLKWGLPKVGAITSLVAAATPLAAYLLSTGRTCNVRKVHIWNRNPGTAQVQIGTGTAPFVPAIPALFAVGAGMDVEIVPDQLQDVEFSADITVQSSVGAAAPNDVQVQVSVEEYPGPNG